MATKPIFIAADHDLAYSGAAGSGSYLNAATITWALKNAAGTTLASGSLTYTASSNGNYTGVVQSTDTSGLTAGLLYYLEITFTQGLYQDFRRLTRKATYRETY